MMARRFRSLQLHLALRLAAVFIAATAAIVGIVVYRAYDTADTLNDRELSLRAADLAKYVSTDAAGLARLDLPSKLKEAYAAEPGADVFAIRGSGGRIISASPSEFGSVVMRWPEATDDPAYFRLESFGTQSRDYYGLGINLDSPAGPLSIWVARAAGADALVRSLLQEFVVDLAWLIPIFMLLTLTIGILAIRGALKPIREVSQIASSIGPSTTSVRLPEENLPSEITPLVFAVNRALGRLEQGFAVQRQFTANAAHELRTPLAIITGALETMDTTAEIAKLKADVRRMNRLVEQLLSVARLDAIALDLSGIVNLADVGQDVVATLAPWALAHKHTVAFVGPDRPALVRGNAHAITDAIRNLLENGVTHSPAQTEVTVTVYPGGRVSVADQGPGVSEEDRQRIFDRFWRGKGVASQGAGLGLAIVTEIMKGHGGSIRVDDGPNGGAIFTLAFTPANEERRNKGPL
jgi:two-component system, OmpR family, sensor histidine kinase TctE